MSDSAPRPHGLPANVALYILSPLAMNGVIFRMHWNGARAGNPMLPPGWVIGLIWMALFTAMGLARWRVVRGVLAGRARWIDAVGLLCLVYPLYTLGLRSEVIGLVGALGTAAVCAVAAVQLSGVSKVAMTTMLCVLAWLLYAETALARDLRR